MNKQQLANRIWASANRMRSKIEANEYKDYILGLIFYKFLSDNEVSYLKNKNNWTDEDLPDLVENYDDEEMVEMIDLCKNNIGYFIEYKNLFGTWLKSDGDFNVGNLSTALNSFDRLVSPQYQGVYKDIFKTLQAGLSKLGTDATAQTKALKELIKLIKDIPTDGSQDYDVLGYVYEYLISNFAANAGKKAGEFYTPHEVAILMSEIVAEHHKNKTSLEIYDPTSGSGSLLITIGKHIEDKNSVKYYAQELKENTYNLTRMNLVMRGIIPDNIDTRCADSLDQDWPIFTEGAEIGKPLYVDAVVSNPPYSQEWSANDRELDPRFKEYGVAPKSKADYAFLLHELHHLKPDGILTIVLPHGVLFRGDALKDADGEGKIRRNLIERNNIDAIIGLPANIFFGTGIPTLIMVLKQHRDNDDVLIIDGSKGFVKDGKSNKLRACDVRRIADCIRDRKTIEGFSRVVSRDEIRENGYNLNIPRYVDSSEAAEQYDIYATMFGGIPQSEIDGLSRYWDALPSLRAQLFANKADGSPYADVAVEDLTATIEANVDVVALKAKFADAFVNFKQMLHARLIDGYDSVKDMAEMDAISQDIFARLHHMELVDPYMAYQVLADQWQSIMGDIEILQTEGFDAVRMVEQAYKMKKDAKTGEEMEVPDGMKGRIMPFDLIQQTYFKAELEAITNLKHRQEDIASELDEIREALTEDEQVAYLEEDDNTKWNKKKVQAHAKPKCFEAEMATKEKLVKVDGLWKETTNLNKKIKAAAEKLVEETIAKIGLLTDEEAKSLLQTKWIEPMYAGIMTTMDNEFIALESATETLAKKYADSLNSIEEQLSNCNEYIGMLTSQLVGDKYTLFGLKRHPLSGFIHLLPQNGESTPKVRFKGFEGEWDKQSASDLFLTIDERNRPELPVLSACQDVRGMIPREKIGFNVSHDTSNEVTYKRVQPGQFVIHLRSFQGGFAHSSYDGIISPAYTVFDFKDKERHDDYYWKIVFMSRAFIDRLRLITYGIRDGRSISFNEFKELSFQFPSKDEQHAIATFFRSLDRKIALETARLEKLKQIKLACLDKMFV